MPTGLPDWASPIQFALQSIGVEDKAQFEGDAGNDFSFTGIVTVLSGNLKVADRVVPSGETEVVTDISVGPSPNDAEAQPWAFHVSNLTTAVAFARLAGQGNAGASHNFSKGYRSLAGETIRTITYNRGTATAIFEFVLGGYRL